MREDIDVKSADIELDLISILYFDCQLGYFKVALRWENGCSAFFSF